MKYKENIVKAYYEQNLHETPVFEHMFHPVRKWRFDIAFPDYKVALEVEGGVYSGGRHTRVSGFKKDIEKYNMATEMGWMVFRCLPEDACMLDTLKMIERAIAHRK